MFLGDHVQHNVLERDAFELRIDREQIDRAGRVRVDVTQVAIGLVTDHVRESGDEHGRLAGDTATSLALEGFGEELHCVGGIGKSIEFQIEIRCTIGARLLFPEIHRLMLPLFLLVEERIVKTVVAKFRKRKAGR